MMQFHKAQATGETNLEFLEEAGSRDVALRAERIWVEVKAVKLGKVMVKE